VEELYLEDLDLDGRRLFVRRSKSLKDRTVFLTDSATAALEAYLALRGEADHYPHIFLYRGKPLSKDLINGRIKAAGASLGLHVYPHRLRHTCATQLLNAGCKVTSTQRFLGHKRLNSTMIYARVHDQTVADDFFAAMGRVEERLASVRTQANNDKTAADALPISVQDQSLLQQIALELTQPTLADQRRLELAGAIRTLLIKDKSLASIRSP
jgi:hypothetical protein